MWSLFLLALLSSCNSASEKAATYSNEIIQHQIEIIDAIDSLKTSFRDYKGQEMDYAYINLQKSIKDGLRKLDNLPIHKNDSTYHHEAELLFKTYESLSENQIPQIIELLNVPDSSFTPDHQNQVFMLQSDINLLLEASHDRFIEAQVEFGQKYGVEFEQAEVEED